MMDDTRYYYGEPRLMESKIIELLTTDDKMVQIQKSEDKYIRLKITPPPAPETINKLKKTYNLDLQIYTSDDNNSQIIEIGFPEFEIIAIRDMDSFPVYDGWILNLIHNPGYGVNETIASIKYNPEHPYGLKIAEHLIEYLNSNRDELNQTDYEQIFVIR